MTAVRLRPRAVLACLVTALVVHVGAAGPPAQGVSAAPASAPPSCRCKHRLSCRDKRRLEARTEREAGIDSKTRPTFRTSQRGWWSSLPAVSIPASMFWGTSGGPDGVRSPMKRLIANQPRPFARAFGLLGLSRCA